MCAWIWMLCFCIFICVWIFVCDLPVDASLPQEPKTNGCRPRPHSLASHHSISLKVKLQIQIHKQMQIHKQRQIHMSWTFKYNCKYTWVQVSCQTSQHQLEGRIVWEQSFSIQEKRQDTKPQVPFLNTDQNLRWSLWMFAILHIAVPKMIRLQMSKKNFCRSSTSAINQLWPLNWLWIWLQLKIDCY